MTKITKSTLEKMIDAKAERKAEEVLEQIFKYFPADIDGNGNRGIKFNDKCGELAGMTLYYPYTGGAFFIGDNLKETEKHLNHYTNWSEVKKDLLKEFQEEETDAILSKLSGIEDFLGDYSER